MRNYASRHTLAVLRGIIGRSQQELAALVGRSPRTIQAIEIGRLPLSEDLAIRVSHETGVSVQWLLGNDLKAPPLTAMSDLPFTKAIFEDTRACIATGEDPNPVTANVSQIGGSLAAHPLPLMRQMFEQIDSLHHPYMDYWLASILSSIFAASKAGRARLAIYRLAEFKKAICNEFGQRIDEEFTRDAITVFENGLQRMKGVAILVGKNGPVSSPDALSDRNEKASQDFLSNVLLVSGLTDRDMERIYAGLNDTGKRIKARRLSSSALNEAVVEQIMQVFASSSHKKPGTKHPATAVDSKCKEHKADVLLHKPPKK